MPSISTLETSSGKTMVKTLGDPERATIIFVSGATLPCDVWDPLVEVLVDEGYQTVQYDLPNRGESFFDRHHSDFEAHIHQLTDVIGIQNQKGIILCGLASGALVVSEFASRQKSRQIQKVVLMAPDGADTHFTLREKLMSLPLLGKVLFSLLGPKSLLKRSIRYSPNEEIQERVRELLMKSMKNPGFRDAVFDTVNSFPIRSGLEVYKKLSQSAVPTTIIWGQEDQITPVHSAHVFEALFGPTNLHLLPDLGHLPFLEDPKKVAKLF
ncbi:MAG: alpha/beta hydrolase [Gammaproteobacteria bacterium]|nr:alpha/beta hydrolase [Gammaproteobacteria bacterium]